MARSFDLVVFGATGYTGQIVAEHLLQVYGLGNGLHWAIAGRNKLKLEKVRDEIGAPTLPVFVADMSDRASLKTIVRQTHVVATTVGPYATYGAGLVAECAMEGTDYVDITGESLWVREMLAHGTQATASGARIVFCCGFDSIPFELGVYFLQRVAKETLGATVARVRGRVRRIYPGVRGGMSGGSLVTIMTAFADMQRDPGLTLLHADPFLLTPGFRGPEQPDGSAAYEDDVTGCWVRPFLMAPVNTKNVHRTNWLLGHPWGTDFMYDEMELAAGPPGRSALPPNLFANPNRPKPGEGPSKADREGGSYDLLFIGTASDGRTVRTNVKSAFDASADSTARLVAESAVCLLRDVPRQKTPGGMWTSAAALGDALITRLEANAGLTFEVEIV